MAGAQSSSANPVRVALSAVASFLGGLAPCAQTPASTKIRQGRVNAAVRSPSPVNSFRGLPDWHVYGATAKTQVLLKLSRRQHLVGETIKKDGASASTDFLPRLVSGGDVGY